MKLLKIIIIAGLLFYTGLSAFVYFFQENLLFFPSFDYNKPPDNFEIEDVYFYTDDNIKLHAWHLNSNSDKTVLFFHGNGGNLTHRTGQMRLFSSLKLNALMIDYRGYGKSGGKIKKEENLYADAAAALKYLTDERQIEPEKIIVWGRSLGGAAAADAAQNRNFHAVIIESSFYSMQKLAKSRFWFLPAGLLLRYHFRNNEKIQNIQSKLVIIHSREDELIPFKHAEMLFKKARHPKHFMEISGSHNTGFFQSYAKYKNRIPEILNLTENN